LFGGLTGHHRLSQAVRCGLVGPPALRIRLGGTAGRLRNSHADSMAAPRASAQAQTVVAQAQTVATPRRHAGWGSAEVRRESTPTPTDPLGSRR